MNIVNKEAKIVQYVRLFEEYNSHTNLMSRSEVQNLYDKHIVDSLFIKLAFEKYQEPEKLLDIGTGGGLPSVPVSVFYEDIEVTALDSIGKKIRFIESVKKELNIDNLYPYCSRAENLSEKYGKYFNVITSRATASVDILLEYAYPLLKSSGYIVLYKSEKADEEIAAAALTIKKTKLILREKINYTLPAYPDLKRCLLIFQKK